MELTLCLSMPRIEPRNPRHSKNAPLGTWRLPVLATYTLVFRLVDISGIITTGFCSVKVAAHSIIMNKIDKNKSTIYLV